MYLSMGVCMWVQVPVGTRDISAPWSYRWLISPHAWVLRPPLRTVSPLTPEPSLPSPDTQISKCGTWWVLTNIHDEVITRVRIAPSFHVLPSEHRHMKSSKVELWVKSIPPSQSTSSVGLLPRLLWLNIWTELLLPESALGRFALHRVHCADLSIRLRPHSLASWILIWTFLLALGSHIQDLSFWSASCSERLSREGL